MIFYSRNYIIYHRCWLSFSKGQIVTVLGFEGQEAKWRYWVSTYLWERKLLPNPTPKWALYPVSSPEDILGVKNSGLCLQFSSFQEPNHLSLGIWPKANQLIKLLIQNYESQTQGLAADKRRVPNMQVATRTPWEGWLGAAGREGGGDAQTPSPGLTGLRGPDKDTILWSKSKNMPLLPH